MRRALLCALSLAMAVAPWARAEAEPYPGALLAPANRQAAWLSLEAPRPRAITRVVAPSYVADVAANAHGAVVIALYSPLDDRIGGDILRLDTATGDMTKLAGRQDRGESLGWPTWAADRVLFQREDLRAPAMGYAYQSAARFPSRVDAVQVDGSGRTTIVDDARQPDASLDGAQITYVRSSNSGTALLVRSTDALDERELIPAGALVDVGSPRFSPSGDQIAFAVATPFVGHQSLSLLDRLLGVRTAEAHGLPWDVWLIGTDGSNPHLLANLGADDPSLVWSPDGRQLFVYGGTGSFIVDVASGDTARYPYLTGYGLAAWLP
ncbi:MAG TPA: hypothetical protein VGL99_27495 [Chloroflexota bacterium]